MFIRFLILFVGHSLLNKVHAFISFHLLILCLGNPIYQMIEIKLALCIEFPRKMGPGVFISCPDIMELFTIEQGDWTFERPGITAIAHPSPIEIGTTHGVFILDEKPHVDCSKQSDLPLVRSLRIGAGAWGRAAYRRGGLGEGSTAVTDSLLSRDVTSVLSVQMVVKGK